MVRDLIINSLMFGPISWIFSFFNILFRNDPELILFGSNRGKQWSDNSKALFEHFCKDPGTLRPVWISRNRSVVSEIREIYPDNAVYAFSLQGLATYLKASQIFVSHSFMDMCYFPPINGKTVNYLWHGIPMRKIGLSSPDSRGRGYWKRWNSVVDRFFVSSEYESKILREAFAKEVEFVETGNPRNDRLFEKFGKREKDSHPSRVILYAPTWRVTKSGGPENNVPFFHPEIDLKRVDSFLEKIDASLIVRPHAALKCSDFSSTRISFIPTELVGDISDLFFEADVLVTDYSSVYFDWLITGKPIVFSAYDLEEYEEKYGFNEKYAKIIAGAIARTPDEIEDAISDALGDSTKYESKRGEIADLVFGNNRGGACNQIRKIIESGT